MENDKTYKYDIANKLDQIRQEAVEKYGDGAEFAYRVPGETVKYAMLTLNDAIDICGPHMASQDGAMLWTMLDKFRSTAEIILRKDERVVNTARAIGQQSLHKYQTR